MANSENLKILKQGVETWNKWRFENDEAKPNFSESNLSKADLSKADLSGANLSEADLSGANLSEADLSKANLSGANLRGADFGKANLSGADLSGADLRRAELFEANLSGVDLSYMNLVEVNFNMASLCGASLSWANLSEANLCSANLSEADLNNAFLDGANLGGANLIKAKLFEAFLRGADLSGANLSEANLSRAYLSDANLSDADFGKANLSGADLSGADFRGADLSGANLSEANLEMASFVETRLIGSNITNSRIYGISAWNIDISQETKQFNLVITPYNEPAITTDNLEVAQFIYLLLNNEKIRDVIDTIGKKAVLILGRFTQERKTILDSIRNELRNRDYLPILFDFEKPASKDLTETVSTLAHMSRFIIADLTEPRSIPHELATIVPTLSVPIQPLLLEGSSGEYALFQSLRKYDWVLSVRRYKDLDDLLESFEEKLVIPAEEKVKELIAIKQ